MVQLRSLVFGKETSSVEILRLAHVSVRTPDLDLSAAYYTEVLGLQQVTRTEDAVSLKCWDQEAPTSTVQDALRPADRARTRHLPRRARGRPARLREEGRGVRLPTTRVSRGGAISKGKSLRFEVPSGQFLELVWDIKKTGNILGERDPSPVPPPDLPR